MIVKVIPKGVEFEAFYYKSAKDVVGLRRFTKAVSSKVMQHGSAVLNFPAMSPTGTPDHIELFVRTDSYVFWDCDNEQWVSTPATVFRIDYEVIT